MSDKSEFYTTRAYFEGLRNVFNARMLINDKNLFITERYNHFIRRLIERVPGKYHIYVMEKIMSKLSWINFDNRSIHYIVMKCDKHNVVVCLRPKLVCDRLCATITTVYTRS